MVLSIVGVTNDSLLLVALLPVLVWVAKQHQSITSLNTSGSKASHTSHKRYKQICPMGCDVQWHKRLHHLVVVPTFGDLSCIQ